MEILPVPEHPALLIGPALVVADIHIGIEFEFAEAGFKLPNLYEKMAERIVSLCRGHGVKEIIILGDLKHNVPETKKIEYAHVPRFLRKILDTASIHIIPGNHDGGLAGIVPSSVVIHPSRGWSFEDIGLFHGHTWPSEGVMKNRTVVSAHLHPAIRLKDSAGRGKTENCWARAGFTERIEERYKEHPDEMIIMPALNPLCGVSLNTGKYLGPLLRNRMVDMENADIHLLDGTYLGKLNNLGIEQKVK